MNDIHMSRPNVDEPELQSIGGIQIERTTPERFNTSRLSIIVVRTANGVARAIPDPVERLDPS